MPIEIRCECGKVLRAPDGAGGRRARCPACGRIVLIPRLAPSHDPDPHRGYAVGYDEGINLSAPPAVSFPATPPHFPRPASFSSPRVAASSPLPASDRRRAFWYWLLLVALTPLAWSTFQKEGVPAHDRLVQTITHHPELEPKFEQLVRSISQSPGFSGLSEEEQDARVRAELGRRIFEILPGGRMEGAFLAHDTLAHWGMALGSAAAFVGLTLLLFPPGNARLHHLLLAGLFTGTAGILLLLGVQWVAFNMHSFPVRGNFIVVLFALLIKFIGFSYRAALDADGSFVPSFLGFTFGVGFCEEVCKALPLIFCARSGRLVNWRAACMWGLVSGAGFGVSEGITYAGDYYNGINGPGVYLVRFVSCVGLHALWAASVGITLYKRQGLFDGHLTAWDWIARLVLIVAVPMALHGLYDTLLKMDLSIYALVVSLASFAWLAFQIETTRAKEFREVARFAAA